MLGWVCHNPKANTTQHNLNTVVGLDIKMTLHTSLISFFSIFPWCGLWCSILMEEMTEVVNQKQPALPIIWQDTIYIATIICD